MDIRFAQVNWNDDHDNAPMLEIVASDYPEEGDWSYADFQISPGCVLYRAEYNDYVRFLHHMASDQVGFGGRTFDLRLHSGQIIQIKGPWSSRAGVVNRYFVPHCVEVLRYNNHSDMQDRRGGQTGHVTIDAAVKAIRLARVHLVRIIDGMDIKYEPVMRSSTPKGLFRRALEGRTPLWEYIVPDIGQFNHQLQQMYSLPQHAIGYQPGYTMTMYYERERKANASTKEAPQAGRTTRSA